MSRYSIVLVAPERARATLGVLLPLRHARPDEVLLVDTAPDRDLSGVVALSQLPVRRLSVPEVGSLGAAYNAGLDAASYDAVLLLHRVLLESDPAAAVESLRAQPDIAVIGGKIFSPGPTPRRLWQAGYRVGRGRVGPTPIGQSVWDTYHEVCEMAAVSGACMLVRRTEVRFDERYWSRLEDVDFCLQYRQRGYRVIFSPALRAIRLDSPPAWTRGHDAVSAGRRLASQWLYHERWCSDLPLAEHPRQTAIRGAAAVDHFREVDAPYVTDVREPGAVSPRRGRP